MDENSLKIEQLLQKIDILSRRQQGFYQEINDLRREVSALKQEQKGIKTEIPNLADGIVNSMNKNMIDFNSTILKNMRVTITNNDNQPLNIDSFSVKGYICELIGHFSKYPEYYLVYGNKKQSRPSFDLEHFRNKIPTEMTPVSLGKEQPALSVPHSRTFFNSSLLWLTMIGIIFLISVFTFKMIKNKNLNVD